MMQWSYLLTVFTDPGSVPEDLKDPTQTEDPQIPLDNTSNVTNELSDGDKPLKYLEYQYCEKCQAVKPPRSHHCSVCERCVLRMDHHCPWVSNCVGFHNHKHFINFNCNLAMFAIIQITAYTLEAFNMKLPGLFSDATKGSFLFLSAMVSIVFGFGCIGLSVYHFWLISMNLSSLETKLRKKGNPFLRDTKVQNFEQIFGTNKLKWFLPVKTFDKPIDGMNFPKRSLINSI